MIEIIFNKTINLHDHIYDTSGRLKQSYILFHLFEQLFYATFF